MSNIKTQNLRTIVRGAYDIQKLRISIGNRIVAQWKAKLGQKPSAPEEDLDDESKEILNSLRVEYKKMMDGVKSKKFTLATFKATPLISDITEFFLLQQYLEIEASEKNHFEKNIPKVLEDYPIYTEFLNNIRGIGPAMAGVITSEFDIHKAKYRSSLWAYAGLDVVAHWKLTGVKVLNYTDCAGESCDPPAEALEAAKKMVPEMDPLHYDQNRVDGQRVKYFTANDGEQILEVKHFYNSANPNLGGFEFVAIYKFEQSGGRSRRAEHLVDVKYVNKDGKEDVRKGITFNPFLKTKLMGVLANSFIKTGNAEYRKVYDDYKTRLETEARWKDESKGHRHNAAKRFMIKRFLSDLYIKWRTLEGLPVYEGYVENKLTMTASAGHSGTGMTSHQ